MVGIDSVLIASNYRKRIIGEMIVHLGSIFLIEGIGFANGLLYDNPPCAKYAVVAGLCFSQNGQVLYQSNSSTGCNIPLAGINETGYNIFFEVQPNHSNGNFIIPSPKTISHMEISNVLGDIIHKQSVKYPESTINLSFCPKGIYFVKAIDEKGNFGVKKIIIQ